MSSWEDSYVSCGAFQDGDHELWKHFLIKEGLVTYLVVLKQCFFEVVFKSCSSGRDTVSALRLLWKELLLLLVYFRKAPLWSYIRTTNLSSTAMHSFVISCGDALRTCSTGFSWEVKFYSFKAFFFPHPLKDETVSHPVGVWNIGRVEALWGSWDIAMASARILCTFFPDP